MIPYRVKYNKSESDIQNNDLLYKIHQKYQNTFELLEISKNPPQNNVMYISSIIICWNFCNVGFFLYLYILHV